MHVPADNPYSKIPSIDSLTARLKLSTLGVVLVNRGRNKGCDSDE